jgi:hypothetical protein
MRTFLILMSLLIAGCQSTKVSSSSAGSANIQNVKGEGEIRRSGGRWERATSGQTLRSGDEARTGTGSQIEFTFREHGGVITLMPNSLLEFDQLGPKTISDSVQAVLNLPAGRVTGDTLKMPPGSKVVIKTPKGVSEIP